MKNAMLARDISQSGIDLIFLEIYC